MRRALDDAIAAEQHRERVMDLIAELIKGSDGPGVSLSARACATLLLELRPKAKRERGRPPVDIDRMLAIAMHCAGREWHAVSVREAVSDTAKVLRVSPRTVWQARKLFAAK